MAGAVTNLFRKPAHGAPMEAVASVRAVQGKGFFGDLSFGRNKRQVLLIESETLDEFELTPGQVRENVTVRGIELAGAVAGARLQVGDVILEVTLDCAPCEQIEAIRPGLRAAIAGRRGTLCRVVSSGDIAVGAEITLLEPVSATR